MVKTLKLALGALAFAYAQKPRADVQNAYEQFLKDFGKHYDEVEKQVPCCTSWLLSEVLCLSVQTCSNRWRLW